MSPGMCLADMSLARPGDSAGIVGGVPDAHDCVIICLFSGACLAHVEAEFFYHGQEAPCGERHTRVGA